MSDRESARKRGRKGGDQRRVAPHQLHLCHPADGAAATKAKDSSTEKDKTSQASSSSSVAAAATEPTSKDSTAGDNNNNAQSDGKSDHSNERTTPKYTFRMFILTAHYDSSVRVWSEHVDATQHNITDHPQQDKIRILQ